MATSLIVFQTPAFGGQSGDQTNSHAGPPLNWGLDQNADTSHTISVHLINVTTPNNKLNLLIAGYLTLNGRLKSFLMACQLPYISIQQYFNLGNLYHHQKKAEESVFLKIRVLNAHLGPLEWSVNYRKLPPLHKGVSPSVSFLLWWGVHAKISL